MTQWKKRASDSFQSSGVPAYLKWAMLNNTMHHVCWNWFVHQIKPCDKKPCSWSRLVFTFDFRGIKLPRSRAKCALEHSQAHGVQWVRVLSMRMCKRHMPCSHSVWSHVEELKHRCSNNVFQPAFSFNCRIRTCTNFCIQNFSSRKRKSNGILKSDLCSKP